MIPSDIEESAFVCEVGGGTESKLCVSLCPLESCRVDPSKTEGVSLHIDKLRPASKCRMELDSVVMEKITVTSDSALSFKDCLPQDIQVTASRVIGNRTSLEKINLEQFLSA